MLPGYAPRLTEGLRALSASPHPLRGRVKDAFLIWVVLEGEFPKRLADRFSELGDLLSSAPDRGDGTVSATVAAMSEDELLRAASMIVDFFVDAIRPDEESD